MITTATGAKKIENTDNWRQIFDAHNDSVDAEDKLAQDMAPIVNGNKSTTGAAAGEYVLVRNSSITGITDGAYRAAQAIPANTVIDSTYLTAITGGIANDLNSNLNGIPEIVSNANGTALKFPSGLMVCYKGVTKTISMTTSWGNQYEGTVACGDWPVEFTATPRAVCSNNNSTGSMLESWTGLSKSSCGTTFFCRPISAASVTMDVTIVGFGRWK